MLDFLRSTNAQLILWMTVLGILTAFSAFVVQKFRGGIGKDQLPTNELLTNLRDLRQEGDISDVEYRKIRTVLEDKIEDEISNRESEGSNS